MSNTDYRAGRVGGGRTTAGWFLLGSPFLLGFALLMSMLFSLIARRARPLIAWLCLVVIFTPLIAMALVNSTPAARLRTALDIEPPAGTRIHRIQKFDSFNDGSMISGVCSADPQFVSRLIATHALEVSDSAGMLQDVLPDEPIPDDGTVFSGNDLTLFYDADQSLLYFFRHLGRRP